MTIEQIREKFKGAYVSSYEKAQKNQFDKYMSHRNDEDIPLVCQELNVLTVEDYDKWYGLYYLMEDPDTKEIMLVTLAWGDILEGFDHSFYPDSVIKFCSENSLRIDMTSFICINKNLLYYRDDLLSEHLTSVYDSDGIVKLTESVCETYYIHWMYDNFIGYTKDEYMIISRRKAIK